MNLKGSQRRGGRTRETIVPKPTERQILKGECSSQHAEKKAKATGITLGLGTRSNRFEFIFILCALVSCWHICLCEGVEFPGTRAPDSCELLCAGKQMRVLWKSSLSVLLTPEPSLQACGLLMLPPSLHSGT